MHFLCAARILIRMEQRAARVTDTMNRAITSSGVDVDTLAQATDIARATITDSLERRAEWTVANLVKVGGFLRLTPTALFGGTP